MREPSPLPASMVEPASNRKWQPLRAPISLKPPTTFYRATGVFAKDIVHHANVLVTMLLASCFALYLPWVGKLMDGRTYDLNMQLITSNAASIYLSMLIACAFVFGLVLSSDEVESRTITLLDSLPCSRYRHLAYKFLAGAVMLIVWAITAALLMGWLSENGLTLLLALMRDKIALFSVALDYPGTGPITLLQCASLLLTGLVSGLLFQGLAGSAILGILAYCAYLLVVGHLFIEKNYSDSAVNWINAVGLIAWAAFMIFLYPRVFRRTHDHRSDAAGRIEATSRSWRDVTSFLQYRRTRTTKVAFDPPDRYLLRVPVATLCGFILVVLPLVSWAIGIANMNLYFWIPIIGFPLAVALVGTGAWLPEERQSARFSSYTLPVSRSAIFWPRVRTTMIAAVLLSLCTLTGMMLTVYAAMKPGDRFELLERIPWELTIAVGAVFSLFLLGFLFRLFYSSRMIATAFAAMVTLAWIPAAVASMSNFASLHGVPRGGTLASADIPAECFIYGFWMFAVICALPIGVSYLGFCRTRLLETSERTRGSISLVLFLLLIIWGGFLLATPPTDIYTILFVH